MKVNLLKVWQLNIVTAIAFMIMPIASVRSDTVNSEDSFSCPNDIEKLTALLLKDLPDYSNRVIQRTQKVNREAGTRNYMITAAQPEFEPLDLPRIQYNSIDQEDPEQVFFTVAEKQYSNNKVNTIQTYHWLFLTQTDEGWRTVMLFSRFGNSKSKTPPSPPKETTNGIIGQGVQRWLRDCRAGTVRVSR